MLANPLGVLAVRYDKSVWFAVTVSIFLALFFFVDSSKWINNTFYSLVALPAAWFFFSGGWRKVVELPAMKLLVFALFACAVSTLFNGGDEFKIVKHSLYIVLLAYALMLVFSQTHTAHLFKLSFTALAIVMLIAVLLLVAQQLLDGGRVGRISLWGKAENPVHSAAMITAGLAVFWLFYIEPAIKKKGWGELKWSLCLSVWWFFCAAVIVAQQSRSVMLGLLSFTVILCVFRGYWRAFLLFAIVVTLSGALGIFDGLLAKNAGPRMAIWTDAFSYLMTEANLWFGNFEVADRIFADKYHHVHSGYIAHQLKFGLLGSVSLAMFLCAFAVLSIRHRSNWFLVSIIGSVVLVGTSNGLLENPRPLWLYFWIPVLCALVEIKKSIDDFGS